ncbi:hypothetical protein LTR17_005506 [Elasticomyces elasticus]|nr:hypothetical protein LTR17_005506 [Elasticomyces elasticus]
MNTTSPYLQTVLNTSSPPPSSSLRRSIPIHSTPFSNLLIPTSATLKSRHVRLNSSPVSSDEDEDEDEDDDWSSRTFDGSDRSSSSVSVSASPSDLRSRCSSKGTDVAGDDWPEDAWTLRGRLLSRVETEGADVALLLGWLEDEDNSIDGDDSSIDEDEDETITHAICVMAVLPSIENEDGYAPPSRKRPLEDAAEGSRKRRRGGSAITHWDPDREAARQQRSLENAAEGSRKCRRLAATTQPQRAGDAAAGQALENAAERSSERRRRGATNYWDPIREAAALENAAERASQMRLSFITEAFQAGDATVGPTTVVVGG